MKKLLSLTLALVLLLTLQVPALAAIDDNNGSETGDVKVNVTIPAGDENDIYSVTINWTNLEAEFTYNFNKWNPETMRYDAGGWGANKTATASADITVSNSSNVDITVTGTLVKDDNKVKGVTSALTNGSFDLAKATVGGTADSNQMTVTVSGTPNDQVAVTDQVIGRITIVIAKKSA